MTQRSWLNGTDYWKKSLLQLKLQETIIYTTAFSPDNEYMVCATNLGDIAIWRLRDYLADSNWSKASGELFPLRCWHAHTSAPIYSLCFCGMNLVSGGDEYIRVWNWEEILKPGASSYIEHKAELHNRQEVNHLGSYKQFSETNDLSVDPNTNILYSASGDNNAYSWDIERNCSLNTFQGHTDYVHCIKYIPFTRTIATGSEDGTVRLWDPRISKAAMVLDCSKNGSNSEPHSEKTPNPNWITCLDTDDGGNWLVCGGGYSTLQVWYLAVPSISCYMPLQGLPHAVTYSDGKIYSGGNDQHISQWQTDGRFRVRIPTTAKTIFSLNVNPSPSNKMISVAGSSAYIDVFSDITYKRFSLCCCPAE